jgi:steroid delta-isomerase-like uncharacterized protein
MTRDAITDMFTRRLECWRAADAASLAAAHAKDGTVFSPMFGAVVGRPAIDRSYEKLFQVFENWTIDNSQLLVDGNRVAQMYEGHSTHIGEMFGVAPTGKSIVTRGVFIFELNEQGLILTERRFYDFSAMLIQIGVLRPKTG